MSVKPDVIYKTDSPIAVAWWDGKKQELVSYYDALETWKATVIPLFPVLKNAERSVYIQQAKVVGVQSDRGDHASDIPSGWRKHKKHDMYVPTLNNKNGKAAHEEMTAFGRPTGSDCELIGVPSMLFFGDRVGEPGFECYDGLTVYTLWKSQSDENISFIQKNMDEKAIDGVVWAPVKMSEWYTLQESLDIQKPEEATG